MILFDFSVKKIVIDQSYTAKGFGQQDLLFRIGIDSELICLVPCVSPRLSYGMYRTVQVHNVSIPYDVPTDFIIVVFSALSSAIWTQFIPDLRGWSLLAGKG